MSRINCFFILTLVMVVVQQTHAACVCNEKGEDACAKDSKIVIPKPKHHKRPELNLPPIGDNCGCSRTMIEPAALPQPCSKHKKPHPPSCRCHANGHRTTYLEPEYNYLTPAVSDYSLPADPISISLAKQAVNAFKVPEAKLAYGFVRTPINRMPKVYVSSIKEENLYALANDVITLKKPTTMKKLEDEEDYPEPEEEISGEDYAPPAISYGQLGYETEQYKSPKFIPMTVPDEPSYPKKKIHSNCGCKSGRIPKIQHIRKCDSNIY